MHTDSVLLNELQIEVFKFSNESSHCYGAQPCLVDVKVWFKITELVQHRARITSVAAERASLILASM